MRFPVLPCAFGLIVAGCDVPPAAEPGPEAPPCEGDCLAHDFGTWPIAAGFEYPSLCWSWTLDNDDPLLVNTVAMQNDGWFHHSNWFWVPDTVYPMPDGPWDCNAGGFTELGASVIGAAIYAQSTQVRSEEQRFLPGAAVRIPEHARIIAASHLLNVSSEPAETGLRLQLHTLPDPDVVLQPFRFTYLDLDIPAGEQTRHTGECDIDQEHREVTGEPLDLRLHYVLPHEHALGDTFTLELLGGPRDGERIFEATELYGEASGMTLAEPLDLGAAGARGLRFSCGHVNQTDAWVGWGIDDQEMCVMLGFADTGMMFDGTVSLTEQRDVGPDGVLQRTGACSTRGVAVR
jgi:hypothetical protein